MSSVAIIAFVGKPSAVISNILARDLCLSPVDRLFIQRSSIARSASGSVIFIGVLMDANFIIA
jgi:hypothetical protein